MNYTCEQTINLPRERVVALFDNPENMYKWQEGLKQQKHISGDPGKPGAKMKLRYEMGKRKMELTETIVRNELPGEIESTYETKGVINQQVNRFHELGPNETLWESLNVFKFSSIPMKLMGFFMKGAFPKQTKKFMVNFKEFAEQEGKKQGATPKAEPKK